jgi:hypothetical protein
MTIAKFKSTDDPQRFTPLRVATDAASARQAALESITSHCLDCGGSFVGHVIPAHTCKNPAGKDNTPMKKARAEGARRELAAVRNFAPAPPCIWCKAAMPSGQIHECTQDTEPLPHERQAMAFVRKGNAAALAAELDAIKGGPS